MPGSLRPGHRPTGDHCGVIVYRSTERTFHTASRLAALRRSARDLTGPTRPSHASVVALLVAIGELEAAAVDALCPDRDRSTPAGARLRLASVLAGRALRESWTGEEPGESLDRLGHALGDLAAAGGLPPALRGRVPEGYAYYGLLPETYLEAAARFARERAPSHVACIGIRSIGTGLSAAVAAVLAAAGAQVESWTVRPRGHPFDRRLVPAPALQQEWAARRRWWFLVVDEGPGLSGSSFASVAEALAAVGVASERIVLFPSWLPPSEALRSPAARAWWPRLDKYVASFEEVWLESGRLARAVPSPGLRDLSAGRWRPLLWPAGRPWPAVQPQHERRKFLGDGPDGAPVLLKFVGLGERGEVARGRAACLAEAGFGPEPVGLVHGFLLTRFAPGRPLGAADVDGDVVERVARYLAFVRDAWPADPAPADELLEMVRVNVGEALGHTPWSLRRLMDARGVVEGGRPVALDARMLAHEWLRTPDGVLKTDATDHHDDHFFPGRLDTAWDLAGAAVELELDAGGQEYLARRYRAFADDPDVARRLAFHRVAYLAHRLGYAALAARASPAAADRARFRRLRQRYTALLRRELLAA